MKPIYSLSILVLCSSAAEGGEFTTYDDAQITHYSATPKGGSVCRYEGGVGGPDTSPSGFNPLSHTIDDALDGRHMNAIYGKQAVMAAVPQSGGTASLYNCFFTLPDAYPGILFFGGDFYGEDSNDRIKVDVSSKCTSRVNRTLQSRIVVKSCHGDGGSDDGDGNGDGDGGDGNGNGDDQGLAGV